MEGGRHRQDSPFEGGQKRGILTNYGREIKERKKK